MHPTVFICQSRLALLSFGAGLLRLLLAQHAFLGFEASHSDRELLAQLLQLRDRVSDVRLLEIGAELALFAKSRAPDSPGRSV